MVGHRGAAGAATRAVRQNYLPLKNAHGPCGANCLGRIDFFSPRGRVLISVSTLDCLPQPATSRPRLVAMIPTLVRRAAAAVKPPPVAPANLYKTKKVWPPDFSKLSPQEQFRFEKRYKRRVKHISARPRWNKMVKLAQLFSITGQLKCR